jgi:hypothetical protein
MCILRDSIPSCGIHVEWLHVLQSMYETTGEACELGVQIESVAHPKV